MPGTTDAMPFTDSYKHMEFLGGMRLQSFPNNGQFVYTRATPGTLASKFYKTVKLFEAISST